MASASIGSGSLVLGCNATSLFAGLSSATSRAKVMAKGLGSAVSSGISSTFSTIGSALSTTLKVGLVGATAAAGTLWKALTDIDEITRGGAAGAAFGLTAEQFTGMAGLAASVGEAQKEFVESLSTLNKLVSDGIEGRGEVAADFFQKLKVNAKDLKAQGLEGMFYGIFEAISRLEDPAERVRALMVSFGEDGGKLLLPLLSKSTAEMRELARSFAITGEQMKVITEADKSFKQFSATIAKLWRDFLVAIAPVLEIVAKDLTEALSGLAPQFQTAAAAVSAALRGIWEVAKLVVESISDIGKALGGLGGAGMGAEEAVTKACKEMALAFMTVWENITRGVGIVVVAISKAVEVMMELMKTLEDKWLLKKDPVRDAVMKGAVADLKGFGLDQEDAADAIANKAKGVEAKFDKMIDDARFRDLIRRADRLLKELDPPPKGQQPLPFGAPQPKLLKDFNPLGSGALKGTREAIETENKWRYGGAMRQLELQRAQLAAQQAANAHLQKIAAGVGALAGAAAVEGAF